MSHSYGFFYTIENLVVLIFSGDFHLKLKFMKIECETNVYVSWLILVNSNKKC